MRDGLSHIVLTWFSPSVLLILMWEMCFVLLLTQENNDIYFFLKDQETTKNTTSIVQITAVIR